MRHIQFFEILYLLIRKHQVHGFGCAFDMVELGRSDNRRSDLCQKPCQRYFRHGHTVLFGKFCHAFDDHRILLLGSRIFKLRIGVFHRALGISLAGFSRKSSAGQSTIGCQCDIFFFTVRHHFTLFLAEDQVVMPLNGNELRKALFLRDRICFCDLPRKAVGDTDISCLTGLHDAV